MQITKKKCQKEKHEVDQLRHSWLVLVTNETSSTVRGASPRMQNTMQISHVNVFKSDFKRPVQCAEMDKVRCDTHDFRSHLGDAQHNVTAILHKVQWNYGT